MLRGHPRNCVNLLRMKGHTYMTLCNTLRTRHLLEDALDISVEVQVAIFLLIIGHNEQNHAAQNTSNGWHPCTYMGPSIRSSKLDSTSDSATFWQNWKDVQQIQEYYTMHLIIQSTHLLSHKVRNSTNQCILFTNM
ncbi:hypothetical protein EJ110_NYTH09818 [Nymphaea thermarum]|nr:hypothetical protein EJ110_NYTH09818 [Nymphaea thermarum]